MTGQAISVNSVDWSYLLQLDHILGMHCLLIFIRHFNTFNFTWVVL